MIRSSSARAAKRACFYVTVWRNWFVCGLTLLTGIWFAPATVSAAPRVALAQDAKKSEKADKGKEPAAPLEDNEVKLGREAAEENDKQVKLVTDAALVERVNRIGQEIAAVANVTPINALWGSPQLKKFNYAFKIVDDKDVNAYSLPGGFIYINKGLMDYIRSDDELAGVLAHEITHAAHHHMIKLMREQGKIDRALLPLKLLAMGLLVTGKGLSNAEAAQHIWLGTQLYSIAKVNTYGVEAEKDADNGGILLLTRTKYNPVGLFSFMTRLAADERNRAIADLGIFRTHPPGEERVEAAKKLLESLNIPIRISEVDPTQQAVVKPYKSGALEMAEITLGKLTLCRVVAAEGLTAEERGHRLAKRLNSLIDARLQSFEVRVNRDQTRVTARGFALLTDADATAQNKTITVLARELSDAIAQISMQRQIQSGL